MGDESILDWCGERFNGGEYRSFNDLCSDGDIEGVQAAIDNGADVNEENSKIFGDMIMGTGLMWALYNGQNNVVQLLLNHPQIDINKVDQDGECALHCAVFRDNHEGMAALLARQDLTTINQRSDFGETPIWTAVEFNAVNCFNLLLAHPELDLDTRDDYQRDPEEVRR